MQKWGMIKFYNLLWNQIVFIMISSMGPKTYNEQQIFIKQFIWTWFLWLLFCWLLFELWLEEEHAVQPVLRTLRDQRNKQPALNRGPGWGNNSRSWTTQYIHKDGGGRKTQKVMKNQTKQLCYYQKSAGLMFWVMIWLLLIISMLKQWCFKNMPKYTSSICK